MELVGEPIERKDAININVFKKQRNMECIVRSFLKHDKISEVSNDTGLCSETIKKYLVEIHNILDKDSPLFRYFSNKGVF